MDIKESQFLHNFKKFQNVFISTDEIVLSNKLVSTVLSYFKTHGFSDYRSFIVDRSFDWLHFLSIAQSDSLFNEKTIIKLTIADIKLGKESELLLSYIENSSLNTVLIVCMPKLDKAQERLKWITSIKNHKLTLWVVLNVLDAWDKTNKRPQTKEFIVNSLRESNISIDNDAVNLLAYMFEGNLISLNSELERIKLFSVNNVDYKFVQTKTLAAAQFSAFNILESLLSGNRSQTLRIVEYMQEDAKEDIMGVLYLISKDIRIMVDIQHIYNLSAGTHLNDASYVRQNAQLNINTYWSSLKTPIWDAKKQLLLQAANRISSGNLRSALSICIQIDAIVKGRGFKQANKDADFDMNKLVRESNFEWQKLRDLCILLT